jgi:hypothetical protein
LTVAGFFDSLSGLQAHKESKNPGDPTEIMGLTEALLSCDAFPG